VYIGIVVGVAVVFTDASMCGKNPSKWVVGSTKVKTH